MFAKLIELLLQAKAGAISGIFLLGATGALISVSASNGVTTITITEASPSPSASASPTASPTPSPSASASPTASPSPTPSASPSADTAACADEAQAIAFQVQRVNTAFSGFHTDLEKLREDRSKDTVKASDTKLKEIRQSAVKAIHATRTCKDNDADKDATTSTDTDKDTNEAKDQDSDHKTTSGLTFSGTAASIADQAIAAMQVAFDTAKNAPVTTRKPEETRHPEGTKRPEAAHTAKPTEGHDRD